MLAVPGRADKTGGAIAVAISREKTSSLVNDIKVQRASYELIAAVKDVKGKIAILTMIF